MKSNKILVDSIISSMTSKIDGKLIDISETYRLGKSGPETRAELQILENVQIKL